MRILTRLREWSGVVALLGVLAGGTAYAANEWTGANIVNGSLTGAEMRDDTVRGADVVESSLGKVPSADKLDNVDSTAFLKVPGLLHLQLRCQPAFAALGVISDVQGLEVYMGGTGRDEPRRDVFAKNGIVETAAITGAEVQELLIQAGTGANTFSQQKLVDITAHWAITPEGDCTATASALAQAT